MATYIVGKRQPKPLAKQQTYFRETSQPTTLANAKYYYVVSKGFAGKLQGYNHSCTVVNGTLYKVCTSYQQALSYCEQQSAKWFWYLAIVPVAG